MIVKDGRCYPDKPTKLLKITAAENLGDYHIRVIFNDSDERIFDGRLLLDGEVFAPLSDQAVFDDFKLDYETLTWLAGSIDISAEYVYCHSIVAK